jgi:hypothetical protein
MRKLVHHHHHHHHQLVSSSSTDFPNQIVPDFNQNQQQRRAQETEECEPDAGA